MDPDSMTAPVDVDVEVELVVEDVAESSDVISSGEACSCI